MRMNYHHIAGTQFLAGECATAFKALWWIKGEEGAVAVHLNHKYYMMAKTEAERLEAAGIQFAYLGRVRLPDGTPKVVTVPVN